MNRTRWIEETLLARRGRLSDQGALVVDTGACTGRAVQDRYIVDSEVVHEQVAWSSVNKPISQTQAELFFSNLKERLENGSPGARHSYEGYAGPFKVHVSTNSAWHAAFCANMFRSLPMRAADFGYGGALEVWHCPDIMASEILGADSPSARSLIVLDFERRRVGIVGTSYAGEIKKSIFTCCNFLLPALDLFPMHAGANCLEDGRSSCVIFGLSGTGKTTLSASPGRFLVGDDEILWSPDGLSNIEGGCYAKLIDLDAKKEPEIYRAVSRFGALLENVVIDETSRRPIFSERARTENTRGSYPLEFLDRVYSQNDEAQAPQTVVFLMADAFGAMPAVAKLNAWQAEFYFLSGYTAKVAGTEIGVREPQAAFSTCFGAPFMPRPAPVYSRLLNKRLRESGASVWLLNTGWTGGPYGVGHRFPLAVSRAILNAIQSGNLDRSPMQRHPIFGFEVPIHCEGVEPRFLEIPTGAPVERLARKFIDNFAPYRDLVRADVVERAEPRLGF